jgi:hypothetical protein
MFRVLIQCSVCGRHVYKNVCGRVGERKPLTLCYPHPLGTIPFNSVQNHLLNGFCSRRIRKPCFPKDSNLVFPQGTGYVRPETNIKIDIVPFRVDRYLNSLGTTLSGSCPTLQTLLSIELRKGVRTMGLYVHRWSEYNQVYR